MNLTIIDHRASFFIWVLAQFLLLGSALGFLSVVALAERFRISNRARYQAWEACSIAFWLLPLLLIISGFRQLHADLQQTVPTAPHTSSTLHFSNVHSVAFSQHSAQFLAVWLLGTGILVIRLIAGCRHLRSIRLESEPTPLQDWVDVQYPSRCMRVRVYTADVSTPLVFGVFRCKLLIPKHLGALLDDAEMRALLLHELGHVRRHDFLRNIIHRVGACIFWFHPVSWLLNLHLARSRELCCDEEAVRFCPPAKLGTALVKLMEHGGVQRREAPGLSAVSSDMEKRLVALIEHSEVQVQKQRMTSSSLLPTLLTMDLLAVCALIVTFPPQLSLLRLAQDPQMTVQARDDAGPFELRVRGGKVFQATFGHDVISGERIAQHGSAVILLNSDGRAMLMLTVEPTGQVAWRSRSRK